jgi:hypothetical protein
VPRARSFGPPVHFLATLARRLPRNPNSTGLTHEDPPRMYSPGGHPLNPIPTMRVEGCNDGRVLPIDLEYLTYEGDWNGFDQWPFNARKYYIIIHYLISQTSRAGIRSPPVTRGVNFGSTCTANVAVAGKNQRKYAGKELGVWQGPAIYCWNDQTFSPADFSSISKVCHSSSHYEPWEAYRNNGKGSFSRSSMVGRGK